jgi:nitrogen regulatory protein P-II 1
MKRIEIIIPNRELKEVHLILQGLNKGGMSYYKVEGSGRIKAERITLHTGATQTQPTYIPRTKVEVVVKDHQVEELISKITDRLTGELGGKIFVVDVPIAVDIRTKKRGDDVI